MNMSIHLLTMVLWLINIPTINSQIILNPTTSNWSGDYFISKNESDLNDGEINCNINSPKVCHIQCSESNSCNNLKINCNNAGSCILDCDGSNTCQGLNLYIGSNHNIINCVGSNSCTNLFTSNSNPITKIYTNYKHFPSSNTVLTCSNSFSCDSMQILDISGGTGYVDAAKFKILCVDSFGGCSLSIYEAYPLATPSIVNSTGEYYFNIGSFLDITCSHNLLCSVDCSGGACHESNINCGDADECAVLCQGSGDSPCSNMDIVASNNQEFYLRCYGGHWACEYSEIYIENVDKVIIDCDGSFSCEFIKLKLHSIQNVEFQCNGQSWPCPNMVLAMNMIDTFTGHCTNGCHSADFNINNTKYFDFSCTGSDFYDPCESLNIVSHENNDMMKLYCTGEESCAKSEICIEKDNMFNLDCCGDQSCNSVSFCNQTNDIFTDIDCECGGTDSCINMTPNYYSTTAKPTLQPTIATFGMWSSWYGGTQCPGNTPIQIENENENELINKICTRSGWVVNGINATWTDGTESEWIGGSGEYTAGDFDCFEVNSNECFTNVTITSDGSYVYSIQFGTSDHQLSPVWGAVKPYKYNIYYGSDYCMSGYEACHGWYVDKIKFHFILNELPTIDPTNYPTTIPTMLPSINPTTILATMLPSTNPTFVPTLYPTLIPTVRPTTNPSIATTIETTSNSMSSTAPSNSLTLITAVLSVVIVIIAIIIIIIYIRCRQRLKRLTNTNLSNLSHMVVELNPQ